MQEVSLMFALSWLATVGFVVKMPTIRDIIKEKMFYAVAVINIKEICDEFEIEDCEQWLCVLIKNVRMTGFGTVIKS